jgi:uncharacterized protein
MTDPFRVLRAPVTPADPDPGFAARLRARVERALDLPEGVAVSDTGAFMQHHPAPVAAPRRRPARDVTPGAGGAEARAASAPRQGDIGYASLWIPDIERAAEFYTAVLGWVYEPSHNPLARQVPGVTPPQGLWGGHPRSTLFCSYVVDDAAAAVARVRAAGGQAGDPVPRPYGLVADCTDNQGTKFAVHQYPAAASGADTAVAAAAGSPAYDGDLAYVTLEMVDAQRARDFYGAVLGWRFAPGRVADGWQVVGTTPMIGLFGGQADATGVPVWRVADLRAAVARVRAAGGTATEPRQEPYGLMADCADDQGSRFNLGELPGG